jgi:hypothetical protein
MYITITKSIVQLSLKAAVICLLTTEAFASDVLSVNFDSGLPAGTLTQGGTSVNLRTGTDAINTYNAGNPFQRFSFASGTTFFNNSASNKFLVLGDDSGQLAGSPDNGTFGLAIPFNVPTGSTSVSFSFDWVFKAFVLGGTGGSTDRFVAGVAGQGFNMGNPLNLNYYIKDESISSQGALQGPATATVNFNNLGAPDSNGNYYLVFGLLENTGTSPTTNSAVGIDNVLVTAVPEPEQWAMFLMGLPLLGRIVSKRQRGV